MNISLLKTMFISVALSSALFATTYNVDTAHSQVGFKIKHMMISNVTGYFKKFNGTFDIQKGKVTAIKGTVDVTSVDTDNVKRDTHLNNADFFDTSKFPKMTFVMTGTKGDKIVGTLSMRGVSKTVVLSYDMGGEINDPWGNKRAGLELIGTIDRTLFGVSYSANSAVLANTVKIIVELEGIAK